MFVFGFTAAWEPDEDFVVLSGDVFAANASAGLLDSEAAGKLGVPHSALSDMKAHRSPGPAIGRFSKMPARWWVVFLTRQAIRRGLRIIEDSKLVEVINSNRVLSRGVDRLLRMHLIRGDKVAGGQQ